MHNQQPFDARAFLALQVSVLVQAGLTTLPQARAAVEELATDGDFWAIAVPLMDRVATKVDGILAETRQAVEAEAQRRKPGLS